MSGTSSTDDADFLRALGVETVIDYRAARFEDLLRDVDVVLDTVGGETLKRSWRPAAWGTLVSTAARPSPEQARIADARGVFFIVEPSRPQLVELARLIDEGRVRPVLEAVFPLAQARVAFERGLLGHHRGKIVLQVAN